MPVATPESPAPESPFMDAGYTAREVRPGRPVLGSVLAALVLVLCLLPCLAKPVHVDDLLFVRAAQRIAQAPGDFHGESVNWYGEPMPLWEVAQNPPLASYWLAAWASLAGWSEVSLHASMLVWAALLGLGMYALAELFCKRPAWGAMAGVLTPVVLISASTLMCDVMLLALWVWAAVFWVRGVRAGRLMPLLLAALLTALCGLAKYFGISLVPLLAAYALLHRRNLDARMLLLLLPLLLPIAAWLAYDAWTAQLYGQGLLFGAMDYASSVGRGGVGSFMVGLAFLGGCLLPMAVTATYVWRPRGVLAGVLLALAVAAFVHATGGFGTFPHAGDAGLSWGYALQVGLCVATGAHVLALAMAQASKDRDADGAFLLLWAVGTLVFAALVNWTVNARSLLPLAPAAGILLVRGVERATWRRGPGPAALAIYCGLALALSASALWADCRWAQSAKQAALAMAERFEGQEDAVRFQGHWGFQYYMEALGFTPLDQSRDLEPGWTLILPENNTNVQFDPEALVLLDVLEFQAASRVAVMHPQAGAGFYSDVFGPLPLVFGPRPKELYFLFMVDPDSPREDPGGDAAPDRDQGEGSGMVGGLEPGLSE